MHIYLKLGDFKFLKLTFSLCLPTVVIPFSVFVQPVVTPWHLKFIWPVFPYTDVLSSYFEVLCILL